jgi:hypothetical protein
MPAEPSCNVNIKLLAEKLNAVKGKLLFTEVERAKRCITYLTVGAPAFQIQTLPACYVPN